MSTHCCSAAWLHGRSTIHTHTQRKIPGAGASPTRRHTLSFGCRKGRKTKERRGEKVRLSAEKKISVAFLKSE